MQQAAQAVRRPQIQHQHAPPDCIGLAPVISLQLALDRVVSVVAFNEATYGSGNLTVKTSQDVIALL